MPFNVVNRRGEHVGVVVGSNTLVPRSLLVAVTPERLSHEWFDIAKGREELSGPLGCRGFMRVNEEKLDRALEERWEKDYRGTFGSYDANFLMKLLLLIHSYELARSFSLDATQVRGYIALSREIVTHSRDELLLDENIEYVQDVGTRMQAPVLHCRITDYPVVRKHIVPMDMIGRYSYVEYETSLKLESGNVRFDQVVPMQLNAKQGLPIALTWQGDKIKTVLCDEVIYRME